MRPDERDTAYLWDMLHACEEITGFAGKTTFAGFTNDRKLVLAIERCLEIIGAAAGCVSIRFQSAHSEIPWKLLKGMRNILAHEYGQIDYEVIYSTVIHDVPALLKKLKTILR